MKRVVVVGGGNAGSIVANKLSKKGLDVKVIEPLEYHLYQPGIIDYALGKVDKSEITKQTSEVLSTWIKNKVTKVDLENHTVNLANGEKMEYEYLVISAGVKSSHPQGFPEWHSLEGAEEIKRQIDNFEGKRIVIGSYGIIKCPAAPFELSFMLKERFPKAEITLLNPVVSPPPIQKPMAEILGKRSHENGINVIRGFKISEVRKEEKTIFSENGDKVEYDLAFIDGQIKASEEFKDLTDNSGLIPVDKNSMKVKDLDNVFAIGDITNIISPPKTGAIAHFEANFVVKSILSDIYGSGKTRFNGDAACAVYTGNGLGSFIYMNYEKSFALGPNKFFANLKTKFGNMYWRTIRGELL
ncbi:NAD(P)/FAD-dependent oxidoreductase [Acidianus sp. RZ1]|uniref:NAD(P)/FAD-dependent oxidoreductase n=1 Tax=Acidianus sp. RZ1 TaxID=1540082 RepID=UPI0014919B13|nr:FAD-dependent oxidoreductase [Acidianus sp. RZ1]NON63455.1 FAD-dependent oxidoreductase [Acidianus sp. RZ1]